MTGSADPMDTAVALCHGATRLAQRMRAERPADGLTMSMLSVLGHLYRVGPSTAGRLATLQRNKPQTLTRTLSRLEEEGLVRRWNDPADRRQTRIELTSEGREKLLANMRPRAVWLAGVLESLSPTERGLLRLAGELMVELANRELEDEPPDSGEPAPEPTRSGEPAPGPERSGEAAGQPDRAEAVPNPLALTIGTH